MYCYYLLLIFTLLISSTVGSIFNRLPLCTAFHTCEKNPHKTSGGHYIGLIYQSCDPMICEKYDNDICVANDQYGHCVSTGAYKNCYDDDGDYLAVLAGQDITYLNPWSTSYCKNQKEYTVNANDNRCYYSSKGNKVLISGLKKRTAKAAVRLNNRCLVGAGWCPC